MSLDLHTVSVAAGSAAPTKQDRVQQWSGFGLATLAGAAGVAVGPLCPFRPRGGLCRPGPARIALTPARRRRRTTS